MTHLQIWSKALELKTSREFMVQASEYELRRVKLHLEAEEVVSCERKEANIL